MRNALALATIGLVMMGCDQLDGFRTEPGAKAAPVVIDPVPPSAESLALAAYYARVEAGHRTRGLLRTDGGGPDTPYDADRLAKAFSAIAFAREFSDRGSALVQSESASVLHRWNGPVRIEPVFGASVPDMQRADDRATVKRYAERLQRATQHPIQHVEQGGNFQVVFVSEEERRVIGPLLSRLVPSIRQREIDLVQDLARENYCIMISSDSKNDGEITRAVAVIRAELPPILRLSCIHEEIAQGLGLANDSGKARPSIFNDDDEFARLTGMDEKLLQMLYDVRLRPGMDAKSAVPVVTTLARDLTARGF